MRNKEENLRGRFSIIDGK